MNTLFFDEEPLTGIDGAYVYFRANEFASPTRSTIPLLSWIKHEGQAYRKVLEDCGIPDSTQHIEFSVKPEEGNKPEPSQTDLMVFDTSKSSALAIEAKWTEPPGEKVDKWLKNGNTENKKIVLNWWLKQLQKHANTTLSIESVRDLDYQMLHRAASPCVIKDKPLMAYLAFHDNHSHKTPWIETNLKKLWDTLGKPQSFRFFYIQIEIETTDRYKPLLDCTKSIVGTLEAVLKALRSDDKLFTFSPPKIVEISKMP